MTEITDFYRDTWYKLQHPLSLDHIIRVLENVLNRLSSNSLSEDEYELLNQAFHALQEFTIDDPATGQKLILAYLMPTIEALRKVESLPTRVISNCRTSLAEWIAQYNDPEHTILRDKVLDKILETWGRTDSESACWTISAIGYRRPDIVKALWHIAERHPDSKVGDDALSVLTGLGVPSDKRPPLLKTLHERASKRYNLSLISALSHLADPSSIDVVRKYWLIPQKSEESTYDQWLAIRILLDICDKYETNSHLQDRIWCLVSELFRTKPDTYDFAIYLGSDIAPRCNSPYVISNFLAWRLLNEEDSNHYARYLLYVRLEECIQPRQLKGWKEVEQVSFLEILRQDALVDSERGVYPSQKSDLKTLAWHTLLRAGYVESLNWIEDVYASESSSYMKEDITKLLACFRLQPLPPSILQWVTEPYPYQTNGQYNASELSLRLAAIQMARSAASCEAFRALLDLDLTVDGRILQSSVHALADVAVHLVYSGEVEVIRQLVETVLSSAKRTSRIAAAGALESLVAGKLVSTEEVSTLLPLILDEKRDGMERGILVNMLGFLPVSFLTSDILKTLKKWALQREDWLGHRSLETLARLDLLLQEPELLSKRLGLRQIGEQWDLSENAERLNWSVFLIGRLYAHHPARFEPAVVSLVRRESWMVTVQITDLLAKFYEQHAEFELPDPIENALFERTLQSRSVAETECFKFLARLSANRLALERWEEMWHDWLPAARVTLADSLGQAIYTTAEANKRASSLLLLLTRDGQYAVRRAAYRGLSRHAPDSFTSWCHVYAEAPEVELRQRAAEAIAWLGNEKTCPERSKQSDLFSTHYQKLATDPEPTVRETAQRIRIERRERLWAEEYLQLVSQVKGESNEELLSCWRYGQALTKIGNDSTIEALRTHLATTTLPPNVKYWIQQLIKETKVHWDKKTKKWPEPWFAWEGTIEEGQGVLFYPDSQSCKVRVRYSLWYKTVANPEQSSSWGGKVRLIEKTNFKPNGSSSLTLHLEDGRQGRAFAKSYPWPFFGEGDEITLLGNGMYPV